MRNFLPTLLCLCLLAVLSIGCNKDAVRANSGADPFLAPATAPDIPPVPRGATSEEKLAPEEMAEKEPVDFEKEKAAKLTPEEIARVKRMGPGRVSPPPATKSNGEPVTPGTKSTSMPNPNKPVLDYDRAVFAISKTACYGGANCRQFSLELTNDRRLVLNARKNMDRRGKYSRQLSAPEYNALLKAMEATEPAELGMVYPADTKMIPADAQATVLRYADVNGEERKVEVYSDAPKQLAQLLADLENWVDKDGWIKMAE